jgi:hypothetical protein
VRRPGVVVLILLDGTGRDHEPFGVRDRDDRVDDLIGGSSLGKRQEVLSRCVEPITLHYDPGLHRLVVHAGRALEHVVEGDRRGRCHATRANSHVHPCGRIVHSFLSETIHRRQLVLLDPRKRLSVDLERAHVGPSIRGHERHDARPGTRLLRSAKELGRRKGSASILGELHGLPTFTAFGRDRALRPISDQLLGRDELASDQVL